MRKVPHLSLGVNKMLAVGMVVFGVLAYIAAVFVRELPPVTWIGLALVAAVVSIVFVRQWQQDDPSDKRTIAVPSDDSLLDRIWWVPYLLPLPAFLLLASDHRLLISNHGAYHSLYIFHLLNGPLPPDNVLIPGLTANIYWLYHALLAAIMVGANIAAPVASHLLNAVALIASYFWGASIVSDVRPTLRRTFRGSLIVMLTIFGGNLAGGLHAAYWHIASSASGQAVGVNSRYLLIDGDTRSGQLLTKMLNFNGFPLGVMFYLMAMAICVRVVKRGLRLQDVIWLCIALLGATQYHFVTATFIVAVLPITLIATLVLRARWEKLPYRSVLDDAWRDLRETSGVWIWGIGGVIIIALMGQYVLRIMSATPPGTIGVTLVSYPHAWLLFGHTYPLIVPFVFAVRYAVKQQDTTLIFLSLVAVVGLALAWFLNVPDGNEYKYVMLATMAISPTVFVWIVEWSSDVAWGRVLRVIGISAASVLLVVNIGYAGAASASRFSADQNEYVFQGRHVIAEGDIYQGAFDWLNANTSLDSVVMLPIQQRDYPAFTMLERLPYVTDAYVYGEGIPEYHERYERVGLIYNEVSLQEEVEDALAIVVNEDLPRPLYMIIPASPKTVLHALEFEPLYQDAAMTVVRLR